MAHHKSAKKRIRQSEKRRLINKSVESKIKTLYKKVLNLEDKDELEKAYKEAVAFIDQSADKGYIHKNNAARKKSRLTLYLNKMTSK
ncbi:MAG: 30S ribosomal protein S20 [Ignavibacterium sp.]|nr:30S ribosomal protein S20 [Ignavibacterium sp.]MDW8375979.1 30S ribosomal protein S20 [Ignavibacteriales bacterium]